MKIEFKILQHPDMSYELHVINHATEECCLLHVSTDASYLRDLADRFTMMLGSQTVEEAKVDEEVTFNPENSVKFFDEEE